MLNGAPLYNTSHVTNQKAKSYVCNSHEVVTQAYILLQIIDCRTPFLISN